MDTSVEQLEGRVTLHLGDCFAVLDTLAENFIDACVTDPPYHLTSIVKRFGADNAAPAKSNGATGVYARSAAGFMGKKWDGGDIAFQPDLWRKVFRVLKPGAHLCAFGGTRTYHRMACAIEDAGFEIRDCIQWLYGSGFPKSLDVSKAIDRAVGAKREVLRTVKYRDIRNGHGRGLGDGINAATRDAPEYLDHSFTAPATESAIEWSGFGTALKPACEPIVLARKPLSEGTVAANVLRWGCGALNIDGCRIGAPDGLSSGGAQRRMPQPEDWGSASRIVRSEPHNSGRWPANIIHDGSDDVVGAFPDAPGQQRALNGGEASKSEIYGKFGPRLAHEPRNDSGSAARFFYTAKADSNDRVGSKHPTVKPVDLMQWLVRLVTPPKGLVLDCFAGTGTTGEAAFREGMRAVLIERETEYQEDIRRRMRIAMSGPDERAREAIKQRMKDKPVDAGPLFGVGSAI